MTFGNLLAAHRRDANMTLRDFAAKIDSDASNISKIERGVLAPPAASIILRKWAKALMLSPDSAEYNQFISEGISTRINRQVKSDNELEKLLPAFCRTVENKKLDPAAYKDLMNILRQNM